MDASSLTQSPFAVLTFIVAPALLTNSSSVLAMSTINRMLRTRERMHELFLKTETAAPPAAERQRIIDQVNRVEKQGAMLLRALHAIYVALAAFASATLVTLLGAGVASFQGMLWLHLLSALGLVLGFVGVGGLVVGCVNLFHATQISLMNIHDEAEIIRQRQAPQPAK